MRLSWAPLPFPCSPSHARGYFHAIAEITRVRFVGLLELGTAGNSLRLAYQQGLTDSRSRQGLSYGIERAALIQRFPEIQDLANSFFAISRPPLRRGLNAETTMIRQGFATTPIQLNNSECPDSIDY